MEPVFADDGTEVGGRLHLDKVGKVDLSQKSTVAAFRAMSHRQARRRPYEVNLKFLNASDWERLATDPCQFCGSNQMQDRGLRNIAVLDWNKRLMGANVLPCCELCWSIRHGRTPAQLRDKCMKIVNYIGLRRRQEYDKVFSTLSAPRSPPRSVRDANRRERTRCQRDINSDDRSHIALMALFPCYYCGETSSGVDRLRSSGCPGYIAENMVPCCPDCNKTKHVLPRGTFLRHVEYVASAGGAEVKAMRW